MDTIIYQSESKDEEAKMKMKTEITVYLWAGFLGEWDSEFHNWTVWELISQTEWKRRPDIVAPPKDCIAISEPISVECWEGIDGTNWMRPIGKTICRGVKPHRD